MLQKYVVGLVFGHLVHLNFLTLERRLGGEQEVDFLQLMAFASLPVESGEV